MLLLVMNFSYSSNPQTLGVTSALNLAGPTRTVS